MDTKHTPGPWVAVELVVEHGSYLIGAQPGHEQDGVLRLADTVRGRPAANAHLMAAAPDLLAALRNLLWQHDNHGALMAIALQDARAAIAKSES